MIFQEYLEVGQIGVLGLRAVPNVFNIGEEPVRTLHPSKEVTTATEWICKAEIAPMDFAKVIQKSISFEFHEFHFMNDQ